VYATAERTRNGGGVPERGSWETKNGGLKKGREGERGAGEGRPATPTQGSML
jgi:hypothetical protein